MPWGGRQVEVLVQVVSALFDINPSMNTHMAMPLWKRCVGTLLEVRDLAGMALRACTPPGHWALPLCCFSQYSMRSRVMRPCLASKCRK